MDEHTLQAIKDIISAGNKIEYYLRRMDYEGFRINRLTIDYVLIHLDRIGQAAALVPPEIQAQYSSVKWTRLTNLRAEVTKNDNQIDEEALWKMAKRTVPRLQRGVEKIYNTYHV